MCEMQRHRMYPFLSLPCFMALTSFVIALAQGLVSKKALSFVIQRCVPGASEPDQRYVSLMLDAALPRHTAISIEVWYCYLLHASAMTRSQLHAIITHPNLTQLGFTPV